MKKNKKLSFIISIVVSVVLLYWLLSSIEEGSILELFQNLFWPAFFSYLACMLIGFIFRSLRYCLLIGEGKVSLRDMFLVVMVRQVFVDLLPMKIGELSYVVLLKKRFNIPVETGMSSMMAVFLFDSICLFPPLFLSLVIVGKSSFAMFGGQFFFLTLLILAFLILIMWKLDRVFTQIHVWLDRILMKMGTKGPSWVKPLILKCEKIADELAEMKQRKIYLKTFIYSMIIRIFKYLAIYSLTFGLLRYKAISLSELSIFKIIIGLASAEFTSFLPIQGLAGFGTWEAAWALTFQWMGFSSDLAILSGFGTHLATQVTEYIIGAICLILLWLPWRKKLLAKNVSS